MRQVTCDKTKCTATSDSYRFELGAALQGILYNASGSRVLELDFAPTIDGKRLENCRVESVEDEGGLVRISAGAAAGVSFALLLQFHDEGLSYGYHVPGEARTLGAALARGEFRQIHNFDPDLSCLDIPDKVELPVQISSRLKAYDKFFQLDHGNYMMPPYLLAVSTADGQLVGFGLLDVPAADVPFDATVSKTSFCMASPKIGTDPIFGRCGVWLANSRSGILRAYRQSLGLDLAPKQTPEWWKEPIYTTWGDQLYRKYVEHGRFTEEAGAEKMLSAELVESALAKLSSEHIHPRTIVLDEGWSPALGDWDADDAKFGGSLKAFIAGLHSRGCRVILHLAPTMVKVDCELARQHPDWLVKDSAGQLRTATRSGRSYNLLDWSNAAARSHATARLSQMVSPQGLGGDGVKVASMKFLPEATDAIADASYGRGERYLLSVIRDIHAAVKAARGDALISLNCLNPLFAEYFDMVRLGNISEVNHELYVQRAHAASHLMPGKPIDTDDWAAFQKVVGATTFIKALAGVPNIFSAFYRGDGRLRVQGAPGGHPMQITPRQYRILAAAFKLYELSKEAPRGELSIDFDRMEFSTQNCSCGLPHVRTHQGGNILVVCGEREIYASCIQDTTAIIDLPEGSDVARVVAVAADGGEKEVEFKIVLGGKLLFKAGSCQEVSHYVIRLVQGAH